MDIEDEIDERLRGDYEQEDDMAGNSKQGGWLVGCIAALGASVLSPIFTNVASAWFGDVKATNDAVIELTFEVRGLKEKLATDPYATREELREVRSELAGFDERLDKHERAEFTRQPANLPR